MYTIEIEYSTGDSFSSHDETDYVGYVWEDIDKAKEALKYIKEHYAYVEGTKYSFRGYKLPEPKPKWFIGSEDDFENKYYLMLPSNTDGEYIRVRAFWVGYFESLQAASVVTEDSKE